MLIRHNFDNRVSYAITKSTTERIGCVCRRRTIQNYRSRARFQLLAHSIPLCIGSDLQKQKTLRFINIDNIKYHVIKTTKRSYCNRRGGNIDQFSRFRGIIFRRQSQRKFAAMIHVKVIMSWIIRVKYKLFYTLSFSIEQDILKKITY